MGKFCEVRPAECYCDGKGCKPVEKEPKQKKDEKQKKRR